MLSRIQKIIKEYKDLKYLAYHDPLTGLLNRNWLYKNMNNIKRKYVYFIDINGLREINKSGHTFGDKHIVKCIKSIVIDKSDYFVRYAGDEFILITDLTIIKTNNLFSVGKCEIKDCLDVAINLADQDMIKSKHILKINRN